jgi:hypothetical protein
MRAGKQKLTICNLHFINQTDDDNDDDMMRIA